MNQTDNSAKGLDRYDRTEKIGEGTYGVVYKATDKTTGDLVALKRVRFDAENDEGVPSTALREIAILKEMRHPNVVCLREVMFFGERKKLYMVFDFHQTDLKRHMDRVGPIPPHAVKEMLLQLVEGLNFCHARRILHRDLKPQNLLVDSDGVTNVLKIADFGLARAVQRPVRKYTKEVVTLWYRPPEILLGLTHYSSPADIWGIGCIFAEMAQAKHIPMFPGDSEIDQIFRIFRTRGTPTEDDWEGVSKLPDFNLGFPQWKRRPLPELLPDLDSDGIDLLENLLQYDPKQRITAKSVLDHPYFTRHPAPGAVDSKRRKLS